MRNWKPVVASILIFAGLSFTLGFFTRYHLPRLKTWLLVEIEKQSRAHSPFQVWAQDVELSFLPLGIVFKDIKVVPEEDLKKKMAPIKVESLGVSLNWWALLAGEVRVSTLYVQKPEVVVVLDKNPFESNDNPKELPAIDWKKIFDTPVDEVAVEKLNLVAKVRETALAFRLKDFSLRLENRYDSLLTSIKAPYIQVKQIGPHPNLELSFETRFLMDPKEIQLAALKIQRENSHLVASGRFNGNFSQIKLQSGALDLRGEIDLSEIEAWSSSFLKNTQLPPLRGRVDIDARILAKDLSTQDKIKVPDVEFSIETQDLAIEKFEIDQLILNGDLSPERLSFKDFRIQHPAGQARIKNLLLHLGESIQISGEVESQKLELGRVLKSVGVKDAPLHVDLKGQFPCAGEVKPKIEIKCTGEAEAKNIHIYSESEESENKTKTILKAPLIGAKGEFTLTDKLITYTADLFSGEKSKGKSKGEIQFDTGFKIDYSAENLDFADVEDLSGLKLEGATNLIGTTEGDSKTATFKMNANAKDFWMADFFLGQAQAELRYGSGVLNVRKIKGAVGTSRYEGQVAVNLNESQILLSTDIPFADLEDVRSILQRRLPIPFSLAGTGSGKITGSGPLDFDKMDYELTSSFYRGTVEKESFDEVIFNVSGSQGVAKARQAYMTKGSSRIELKGSMAHEGNVDVFVTGKELRLEQSESLSKLGFDMTGRFDFSMSVKGDLPRPRMDLNGDLTQLVIGDRSSPDSNFQLAVDSDRFSGKAILLGSTVNTNFQIPLKKGVPFEFNFESKNWDFTQLFQILSQSARQKDFETRLTSKISLKSSNGEFWSSNGYVNIDNFLIKRGNLSLNSPEDKSMKLIFDQGRISTEDFMIEGQNSFLRLESQNSTEQKLNASLNGKFDMALLALLTPFLDDLRGPLSLSMSFQGEAMNPQIIGSAYVDNGFIKLKEFPHPFERVRADILFNQKNILINAMKSEFAGGSLAGDGRIRLESLTEIPVNVSAQFKDVNIQFPEGIQSQGAGQVEITGDYFPYTLKLDYGVTQSLVSMEFTGAKTSETYIKPSSYLPKFLTKQRFQSLVFDIDIDLLKPAVLKNSMADALVKGQLKVKGSPENPLLKGTLTPLPGGKLKFRENIFEIITGYVEYNFNPPNNPTIYISSQARVTETIPTEERQIENEYDVRLLAQGQAKSPRITLESQPPLSEREIVSLLALGMTSTTLDQGTTRGDQQSAAAPGVIGTQIGAQLFESQIGKQFKDRLGVDVKIGTAFNTDENASFPKVTFSKQWTPNFEASASRTIEPNPTSDVKLEYKFNRNTSAIGFWEGRQEDPSRQIRKNTDENKVGLDLEYKVEFK